MNAENTTNTLDWRLPETVKDDSYSSEAVSRKLNLAKLKRSKNVIFMRHGKIEFSYHALKFFFAIHTILDFVKYNLMLKRILGKTFLYEIISKSIDFLRKRLYAVVDSNLDYKDFNYEQFMMFLLKEADPPLSKTHHGIRLKGIPKKIDVIYYSPAKRSIQTAKLIRDRLAEMGYKKPRISSQLQHELAEVKFSKNIISKEEFVKHGGLQGCREIILQKWYNGNNIETFNDSIERVEKLCAFLKAQNDENILLITHGWYIRLLYAYFHKERKDFANLKSKDNIDKYGKSFQIRLTNSFSPDPSFDRNLNSKVVSHPEPEIGKKYEHIRQMDFNIHVQRRVVGAIFSGALNKSK